MNIKFNNIVSHGEMGKSRFKVAVVCLIIHPIDFQFCCELR